MDSVRLNITLPKNLVKELNNLVGPRKKSRFIAQAMEQKLEGIKKEKLFKLLEEGYKANKAESLALAKEFEAADIEGWDEY